MTITLNLRPEIEAGLLARARANDMTLEDYLLSMLEGAVLPEIRNPFSPEERVSAFEAWPANHRPTPPLSDFAASRADPKKRADLSDVIGRRTPDPAFDEILATQRQIGADQ